MLCKHAVKWPKAEGEALPVLMLGSSRSRRFALGTVPGSAEAQCLRTIIELIAMCLDYHASIY